MKNGIAYLPEDRKNDGIVGEAKPYEGGDEYVIQAECLQRDAGIKPFDFYIKKGEVNGFPGLLGSG